MQHDNLDLVHAYKQGAGMKSPTARHINFGLEEDIFSSGLDAMARPMNFGQDLKNHDDYMLLDTSLALKNRDAVFSRQQFFIAGQELKSAGNDAIPCQKENNSNLEPVAR